MNNEKTEMSEFLYKIRHELRNPIARLHGITILMSQENVPAKERLNYIKDVQKATFDIDNCYAQINQWLADNQ